jgi:hypothetical protein
MKPYKQSSASEGNSRMTVSKEIETSVLQPQLTEFCQQLE